jgi:hypothetical protein
MGADRIGATTLKLPHLDIEYRDAFGRGAAQVARVPPSEKRAELDLVEAGKRQVEVELFQVAEFEPQHLRVPTSAGYGRLVVGDDVGLALGRREPRKLDGRDFGEADLLRSLQPRGARPRCHSRHRPKSGL